MLEAWSSTVCVAAEQDDAVTRRLRHIATNRLFVMSVHTVYLVDVVGSEIHIPAALWTSFHAPEHIILVSAWRWWDSLVPMLESDRMSNLVTGQCPLLPWLQSILRHNPLVPRKDMLVASQVVDLVVARYPRP